MHVATRLKRVGEAYPSDTRHLVMLRLPCNKLVLMLRIPNQSQLSTLHYQLSAPGRKALQSALRLRHLLLIDNQHAPTVAMSQVQALLLQH